MSGFPAVQSPEGIPYGRLLRRRKIAVGPGFLSARILQISDPDGVEYPSGVPDVIKPETIRIQKNPQPDGMEQREKVNIEHRTSLPAAGRERRFKK